MMYNLKNKTIILLCLAILVLWFPVLAKSGEPSAPGPLLLTDDQVEYPLGLHMEILEDPGGELTIDQVSSPAYDAQFIPSTRESPNYGFTDNAYWVRFSLDNETRKTDDWLLELNFANTQYIDLYTSLQDGGKFNVKQTGTLRPLSTRDVHYPNIVFALSIPTQTQQTYYLRFKSSTSITLPLTLWAKDSFWIHAQSEQMQKWLFYGAILALLIYHLFLLYNLREVIYLYFVLLLASVFVATFTYDGYMGVYLFPNIYSMTRFFPVSLALGFTFILLFSDAFLDLRSRFPKLHLFRVGLIVSWGVMILLAIFTSYSGLIMLFAFWEMISIAVMGVVGIAVWKMGYHPAGFLLLAWLGMSASMILVLLVRLGIVPSSNYSENLFYLGLVWMFLCWAFALADRINRLKVETENANQELYSSEHRLSQILEGMPLAVVMYGKDRKPSYGNKRTYDILSDPSQGIRPDLSAGRTAEMAIEYYSLKKEGTDQAYPLEKFPIQNALNGVPASADDIEADFGDKRISLELWASPVMDRAGNVESAVLVFQDISRRKQVEAELSEYRKHLESLVEKRTIELDASNKELRLRLEWISAVLLITETMARTSDFSQIYEKIIEIINQVFVIQDSFILVQDESQGYLTILAHSCSSEANPELIGSFITLPRDNLAKITQEPEKLVFFSKVQLDSVSGPMGTHLQAAKVQGVVLVPLLLREQVFGFLGLELPEVGRIITSEESNLLRIFSFDIAQLIEDSRLFEQSKALITAEERNRLARDLHDSVTQTLFTASVLAEATPRMLDKDQEIARQYMGELSLLIRGALAEMRSLLIELRSGEMQKQSLDQLLITLVEAAQARTNSTINLSTVHVSDLPENVTFTLYRIAREALNNAILHAVAAQINVSLLAKSGGVELHVQDDGTGFDPSAVPADHLGIRIMVERAAEIGGDVQIQSKSGRGTDIVLTWPGRAGGLTKND